MGGSLVHSREFRVERYRNDHGEHYEVLPGEGGDYDFFSYTIWGRLKEFGASYGMDPAAWPDFTDYESCIDIPLDALAARQKPFRRALEMLPAEALAGCELLSRIAGYVRAGEQVFFC